MHWNEKNLLLKTMESTCLSVRDVIAFFADYWGTYGNFFSWKETGAWNQIQTQGGKLHYLMYVPRMAYKSADTQLQRSRYKFWCTWFIGCPRGLNPLNIFRNFYLWNYWLLLGRGVQTFKFILKLRKLGAEQKRQQVEACGIPENVSSNCIPQTIHCSKKEDLAPAQQFLLFPLIYRDTWAILLKR